MLITQNFWKLSKNAQGYSIWIYMGGGGGGVERSPIKKSWGEGVKIKKKSLGEG